MNTENNNTDSKEAPLVLDNAPEVPSAPLATKPKKEAKPKEEGEKTKLAKVTTTDIKQVPYSRMRLFENVRDDLGDIKELAASILENGVRVPMKGFTEKGENGEEVYVVVAGQRRFTAMKQIFEHFGEDIRAPFVVKKMNEEETLFELFLSNDGKELTVLEKAEGVRRISDHGYATKEIAKKLGKSERYIQKLLKISGTPKKFKDLIRRGLISGTYAMEIAARGEGAVTEFVEKYESSGVVDEHFTTDGRDTRDERSSGGEGGSGKQAKITKSKNEDEKNSVRDLKKFLKNYDESINTDTANIVANFLNKVYNNEVSYRQIDNFFAKKLA